MKQQNTWLLCLTSLLASNAIADPKPAPAPATRPAPATKPAPPAAGYTGLGADSVSAETIAKYVAPPLEDRVSRKIQAMLDIRGPGSGIITSRGDRMVFGSRVTGMEQVWRQDGPMKYPVQLTAGEDRTEVVGLTPDDKTLIVSRDVGGEENPGLYLMSIEGGPLTAIQHIPKVRTSFEHVTDDGKALYFRANDIEPASYAIYRYDLSSRKRELVFDQPGLWNIVDHKGDAWLLSKSLGNAHDEIYRYDVATKQLTPLLGQDESEDYQAAFGAKPGQLIVRTNKLGDFQRLYRFEGGTLQPLTPDLRFDIEEFTIDEARSRIYYELNVNGAAKLFALDARTYKPLTLPKLAEAENTRLAGATSRNGRFIQLTVDGSTLPPQSVTFDWQTKRATTWRTPMTPEVDSKSFARSTLEYYPARDGTKIPMLVRRAASCNTGPCPVVVDFHGGPEGQAQIGFSPQAQLFVDAGFTYVRPNVRGSTGYGKAWMHADDGPKRLAVITDIEDCAKFIRSNWGKDGKAPKIGVVGGSYGGYATLMAMTMFAGAYDAGVSNVGISNLYSFLMNTAPYRRILRISEYGDPVKDKEALIQLSPITHINKIKAPLMIIQGVNDPRVPVGEALQIYKELERRKIPGGLILFPDEGHGSTKRGNIVSTAGHTIAFLTKHLQAQ